MVITDEEIMKLEPFVFEQGKNSYFCKTKDQQGETILLKFFNGTEEEIKRKVKVIKPFEDIQFNGIEAFPKEIIAIHGVENGYSCRYFEQASGFLEKDNILYALRYQAALDTTRQLKFLHKNGYIVNDVRLSNHMICPVHKSGFLVDFEDMILESDKIATPAYYRFYKKGYDTMLPPSRQEDVKKQLICHLSFLLGINFESFVLLKDEWELLDRFRFQKEIYEGIEQTFKSETPFYFDEMASLFQNEEKVKEYRKRIQNQTRG